MSTPEAAAMIRARVAEGYDRVKDAYGWAYANGWRSGQLRMAEMLEGEGAESGVR